MSRSRAERRLVAVIERRGRFRVAEPLFERGPHLALRRSAADADPGRMALVEPASGGARVVRRLGDPRRAADVVDALIWQELGRRGFGRRLEEDAAGAPAAAEQVATDRRDLRDLATFTVDPATARDFDDAVSAQPDGDGIRLWVHIADVAAHVRPGSPLDVQAAERANSTYLPGTVEPMLPQSLSSGACSLVPGVDRLAVTTEIRLDAGGVPRSAEYYRSRIRSDARLDYDQLDDLFAARGRPPDEIAEPLDLARRAAGLLAERRAGRGLEVSSTEPEFSFDERGDVVAARSVPQTEAHRLIEQLMIVTNEQVAGLLERRRVAALYRVHEDPDPARIEALFEKLDELGVPTPPLPDTFGPSQAGELATRASRLVATEAERRGHGAESLASLVLRSLKQAHYSDRNLGHAGLGSPAYAHFTSPIRRYPDLIAHRALLSAVGAGEDEPDPAAVRQAGWHCSERERDSMRLERRGDRVCSAFLLRRELDATGWDREFEGEVSGLVGAGAFVRFAGELGETYEGFLPARTLRGERFDLDATETRLVGRRTGRSIAIGDPIDIRVETIEAARGRTDLISVADDDGRPAGGDGGARR